MAKKVLVVEDDSNIAELLRLYLEKDGFDVFLAADGGEGIRRAQELQPDLILLDIMLPVVDGWVVCSEVRKTSKVPIIMLTAKGETFDKISGLEMGADDYVTKPCSPSVLMKRVAALLRRRDGNQSSSAKVLSLGDLKLDSFAHEVWLGGKSISLTLKEYSILQKLLAAPGRVFTREQMLDDIWGFDFDGDVRTIDSHVARLRTKLGEWGSKHIKTIYGTGYKLEVNKDGAQ